MPSAHRAHRGRVPAILVCLGLATTAMAQDFEDRETKFDESDEPLQIKVGFDSEWIEFNNLDFRELDESSDQAILDSDDRGAFALTGLRTGELASLTVGQLELDGPVAYATLRATDDKAGRGADIPLRADLAADLREWLADRLEAVRDEARANNGPMSADSSARERAAANPSRLSARCASPR